MQMKNARVMQRREFGRVWWPVVIIGLVCLASLYWSARFLLPVVTGSASDDVTRRVLLGLAFAVGGPYLLWTLLRDVLTAFTDQGIVRPTLTGRRLFFWRDLIRIDSRGTFGVLVFIDARVGLNLLSFREPREVVAYVQAHLAAEPVSSSHDA